MVVDTSGCIVLIDFRRNKDGVPAKVNGIEYDPNRSARIALLHYVDGEKRYILAPEGLKAGDTVISGEKVEPNVGNCMPMASIPLGSTIHNVEMQPGRGGQLCRSAGTSAVLNAREENWAQVTLPSGEVRRIPSSCRATIGEIGTRNIQKWSLVKQVVNAGWGVVLMCVVPV